MPVLRLKKLAAFTLIELLIVVLIIAILAAIAVPNFLEFQTRAKVTRVYSDFRTLKLGLEAYYVDNDEYCDDPFGNFAGTWARITTPIAYISTVPNAPFYNQAAINAGYHGGFKTYDYGLTNDLAISNNIYYIIQSYGPDQDDDAPWGNAIVQIDVRQGVAMNKVYDATNGTISDGDIICSNKAIYYLN